MTKFVGYISLLSFDLFKAYDRVFLPFLLKVMKAMNFSDRFCNWIAMLHRGAKTKFILNFLTAALHHLRGATPHVPWEKGQWG